MPLYDLLKSIAGLYILFCVVMIALTGNLPYPFPPFQKTNLTDPISAATSVATQGTLTPSPTVVPTVLPTESDSTAVRNVIPYIAATPAVFNVSNVSTIDVSNNKSYVYVVAGGGGGASIVNPQALVVGSGGGAGGYIVTNYTQYMNASRVVPVEVVQTVTVAPEPSQTIPVTIMNVIPYQFATPYVWIAFIGVFLIITLGLGVSARITTMMVVTALIILKFLGWLPESITWGAIMLGVMFVAVWALLSGFTRPRHDAYAETQPIRPAPNTMPDLPAPIPTEPFSENQSETKKPKSRAGALEFNAIKKTEGENPEGDNPEGRAHALEFSPVKKEEL